MRTFTILAAFFGLSLSAVGQVEAIPTITVTSNDVVQSSIRVYNLGGTNETKVAVKFAFTDTGAKKLKEFYETHSAGQGVRYQIGSFERVFRLDNRKHFGREGFWGLSGRDASALEAGLRGRK